MKKRSVIAALLCSLCLTAGGAVPAMADSARVVIWRRTSPPFGTRTISARDTPPPTRSSSGCCAYPKGGRKKPKDTIDPDGLPGL